MKQAVWFFLGFPFRLVYWPYKRYVAKTDPPKLRLVKLSIGWAEGIESGPRSDERYPDIEAESESEIGKVSAKHGFVNATKDDEVRKIYRACNDNGTTGYVTSDRSGRATMRATNCFVSWDEFKGDLKNDGKCFIYWKEESSQMRHPVIDKNTRLAHGLKVDMTKYYVYTPYTWTYDVDTLGKYTFNPVFMHSKDEVLSSELIAQRLGITHRWHPRRLWDALLGNPAKALPIRKPVS